MDPKLREEASSSPESKADLHQHQDRVGNSDDSNWMLRKGELKILMERELLGPLKGSTRMLAAEDESQKCHSEAPNIPEHCKADGSRSGTLEICADDLAGKSMTHSGGAGSREHGKVT
ncbi:hypothetical protein A6R68_16720 [Neotoma lepida]|uniref:Uncharacterized protein n=1 Tax=Neotoma lepida TaxID=56216 RepID=A0A1A6HEY8_NEOLE|nr:hypothetical protein A6R68_16720 [Neotoma lepida]